LIKFHNVSKRIGQKDIIKNISFDVKKAQLTTLIGPNGAGKTTIARLMLGLEKLSSGKLSIEKNLQIGYVPQKFNFSSDLPMSAEKFLQILTTQNLQKDKIFEEIVDFAEIANILSDDITSLSGGQFQKLIITATLRNNPDLIILDEPTQSLDVLSQQEFYVMINKIKKYFGTTIFMISHDLFTVMKNSDQVICLNKHVCCSGKPGDLAGNKEFQTSLSNIGFYVHQHDHKHE